MIAVKKSVENAETWKAYEQIIFKIFLKLINWIGIY